MAAVDRFGCSNVESARLSDLVWLNSPTHHVEMKRKDDKVIYKSRLFEFSSSISSSCSSDLAPSCQKQVHPTCVVPSRSPQKVFPTMLPQSFIFSCFLPFVLFRPLAFGVPALSYNSEQITTLTYNFTLSAYNISRPNDNKIGAPLVLGQNGMSSSCCTICHSVILWT